ncbi:MAG: UvrB/UvrC motif-containing protein [Candidatus Omnitrophica bacterium]|nr:UvrB/UvrC motif-containing protein [Candidatus Omnitrophota bacterium]
MLCDECSKHKATVHLTEIINDQVTKLNLCESCAKKRGTQMEQHFGIADLLQGLADQDKPKASTAVQKVKCAACGMTFDEFKKIGRLRCARCYETFKTSLVPLLKRIHSANEHAGKTPPGQPEKPPAAPTAPPPPPRPATKSAPVNLDELKVRLKKAVDQERYEEAVALRDEIRRLESRKKPAA